MIRLGLLKVSIALFVLAEVAFPQTKGNLGYNGDKDSGFLFLRGRNDNQAARLSVDGDANVRGFLELDADGQTRFFAYVDPEGEGGLRISSPSGDAVNLYVDDSTNSGALTLRENSGASRVRLFIDDEGRGQLRLEGDSNENRVNLYVDSEDQGGIRIFNDDGNTSASMYVDDSSDTGVLALRNKEGQTRALVRVTDEGRGTLSLNGLNSFERARVYVDNNENGSLLLKSADGATTVKLDGATGTVTRSGVTGFLISAPNNSNQQIFYASLDGPEAGLYTRGSGVLRDGLAKIVFPEHFSSLARVETVTVQVTPTSIETGGLAVIEKSNVRFVVADLEGQGTTSFDWVAMAERSDIDPIVVLRNFPTFEIINRVLEPAIDLPIPISIDRFKLLREGDKNLDRNFLPDNQEPVR